MTQKAPNIMITAFLSEGCDHCVYQEKVIREFGQKYEDIAVFISRSEELMDSFEIGSLPATVVSHLDTGDTLIAEGVQEIESIVEAVNNITSTK